MNRLDTYLAVALVSLAVHVSLMAQEITESDILNPYKQPNDSLTASYGSGDANQDGIVNWDDYDSMVGKTQNDYADVDGNGIASDTLDQRLLSEFLNAERQYLPGHWNHPEHSNADKVSWIENMLEIDQTDTNRWVNSTVVDERFISGNFSNQLYLNFFGYDGDDIPEKYVTEHVGRFNIPVYDVALYDTSTGMGHGMNAFLSGEDPTNFDDWTFIEPQTDGTVKGEFFRNISYIKGQRIVIKGARDFQASSSQDMFRGIGLVGFDIDSTGTAVVFYQNEELTTTRPSDLPRIIPKTVAWDTTAPEIDITYPETDSLYKELVTELKYNLSDEYPDASWYSVDGGLTKILAPWSSDTTIAGLNSEQGENRWIVYAKDKAGNEASDTVRFNVDTTDTAVEDHLVSSLEYRLTTYPNPFNSSTTVEYHLPGPDNVSLKIYDILGREVTTLPDGMRTPGVHSVEFDASGYPAGLYFLELETAKGHREIRKLILLR